MTYSTNHPMLSLRGSPVLRNPETQQIPWNYEYREGRTAVTNLSNIIEAAQEPSASHTNETSINSSQWEYWISTDKSSQNTPSSVRNQLLKSWRQIKPRFSGAFVYLIISSPIRNLYGSESRWETMPRSSEGYHDLARIISVLNERYTSATFISEAQLPLIMGYYVFRDDTEVKHLLRENPFLIQLLLDTYSKIEMHFPDSEVFLEVATDYDAFDYYPGIINNDKELVASSATHLSPDEAMDALDKFYDDWWLKALEEAKGKVSFSLEFL